MRKLERLDGRSYIMGPSAFWKGIWKCSKSFRRGNLNVGRARMLDFGWIFGLVILLHLLTLSCLILLKIGMLLCFHNLGWWMVLRDWNVQFISAIGDVFSPLFVDLVCVLNAYHRNEEDVIWR